MLIVSLPEDNTISVEQFFHTFSQIYSKNLFPTKKLFFPSYIYLYKAEFLLLFVDLFLIIHNLMQLLQCIESIYSIFNWWAYCCFFVFYQIRRYYILSNTIWNYLDINNTITECNQIQTHYPSLILNYFDIYFKVNEKVIL